MFIKLRDNLYLSDANGFEGVDKEIRETIKSVVIVADDMEAPAIVADEFRVFKLGLRSDRMNPPHIKDLACHVPKYMMQCGETVVIQSVTGLKRGAYVACRVLCEQENKTIYEVMQEVQELIPEFDISASYF